MVRVLCPLLIIPDQYLVLILSAIRNIAQDHWNSIFHFLNFFNKTGGVVLPMTNVFLEKNITILI